MIKKSAIAIGILALISSIGLIVDNINKVDTATFAWDQESISSQEAQSFKYKIYADNSEIGIELSSVTCNVNAGPNLYTCSVPLKNLNLTPTIHSLQLTVIKADGIESEKSTPLEVNFLVTTNK